MKERFFFGIAHRVLVFCLILIVGVSICFAQQTRGKGKNTNQRPVVDASAVRLVREAAHPLTGSERDYDSLMKLIGDARFVMLGEATHGTREFYRERARITRRLIEEKGFDAVVLEANWTDAYRVNRYVRGEGNDVSAEKALSGFTEFPRWMWRNTDFRDLVNSLKTYNDSHGADRVGLYGMDVYSLSESIDAVVDYLKNIDPEAAKRARKRYGCFAMFRSEPQLYGLQVSSRETRSCEKDAQQQFDELQQIAAGRAAGGKSDDELFNALQNARIVKNAETYYRTIYRSNISSWNVRDQHMADTLNALINHLDSQGGEKSKIVVWAHNTHQGDARMTERASIGEHNVGQLIRQQYGRNSVLVGFTTYTGFVRAASEWGGFDERMRVRPAIEGSYSALFHKTGVPNFLLLLRDGGKTSEALGSDWLERAIGVIYRPQTERHSHYFRARLSRQFDAVIHFDVTSAVVRLN